MENVVHQTSSEMEKYCGKAGQVQLSREVVLPGLRPRICTVPAQDLIHGEMLAEGAVFWNSNFYEVFLVLLHRGRKG